MNKADFESCVNVPYWQNEVGRVDFINTWSVKGPVVIIRDREPFAVWTDRKTPGYPLEVIVGTLVLTGGNWQGEPYPLDVLKREREEELNIRDQALGLTLIPFADYFTGIPASTIRQEGRKGYCDCSSIYIAEVDEERLYDAMNVHLGNIPEFIRVLKSVSTEADPAITLINELKYGTCQHTFGFGDGQKIYDVLKQYWFRARFQDLEGVHVVRLPSRPSDFFESRREVLEAYLRRGNNPFFIETPS